MSAVSLSDWQAFTRARPELHLLQTGEWGELKSAFGWDVTRLVGSESGVQILFRKLPFGMTIGYMPKARFDESLQAELDAVCKARRAIFCKLEPDALNTEYREAPQWDRLLDTAYWTPSKHNIQPARTIMIDLRGSEDDILARMKQKTRYNIRLAEKKGVIVQPSDDMAAFHKMLQITGGRDGFGVHSQEYYRRAYDLFHPAGMCELLAAEFEGRPLAALMVFARGRRAWYVYGASSDEERNRMPTYLLQWEAMRWAKSRGCEEYDLWGVPDEDEATLEANFEKRHDGLWGVYRFKRGFGGELKRAAQAVDRVYNPWLYKLYLWRMAGREVD